MGTIADKLEYLNDTKIAIKNAIINKGESINDETDTFRNYADKINNIIVSKTQAKSITITENTVTTIKPDNEYTGLNQVNVVTNIATGWLIPGYQLVATRNSQYGSTDVSGTFNIPAGKKTAIVIACQNFQGSNWFGVESATNCSAVVLTNNSTETNGGSGNSTWENASYICDFVTTINGGAVGFCVIGYKITVTNPNQEASIVVKMRGGEQRQGFILGLY